MERLSLGTKLLSAPGSLGVFTAEVVLSSDLDFRWWAPYAFHLWFCFSPTNVFYSEALETYSSGTAPGGAGRLPPAAPAGSFLLGRPVRVAGRCRSLLWDAREMSLASPSSSPTAPEPLAGFARRGGGEELGFGAGLCRESADQGLLLGPKKCM